MAKSRELPALSWLVWLLASGAAHGAGLSPSDFLVYTGDVNADGFDDIYVSRQDDFVIYGSPPRLVIFLPSAEGYLLTGRSDGSYSAPTQNTSVDVSSLARKTVGISFGDFNNDGLGDLLVQGDTAGEHSVLLAGSSSGAAPTLLYQFSSFHGLGVSIVNARITLADVNGDGYADFVIDWVSGSSYEAINLGTGLYEFEGPNVTPVPQVAAMPPVDPVSDAVGATAASFRVDEYGAATYSVPILTAPGVAGVSPEINLNYSSQGANGLLGQGWSIGGLSAITRCRRTIATDGVNGGVGLDANDRLCLDGQRLVLVSGSYGAPGSEYRTEIDEYARIRAYGGATGNPSYFKVWRKDGSMSEYGNTGDSRLEVSGSSSLGYLWAQNSFADSASRANAADNEIRYYYDENNATGEHKIERITWARGDAALEFYYENRSDDLSSYVAGHEMQTNSRLERISSHSDAVELREYSLTYAYGTENHLSQLQSLQECNGTTCYPATTFSWRNPGVGMNAVGADNHQGGFLGGRPADLNGDGVNELIWMSLETDGSDVDYYLKVFAWDGYNWDLNASLPTMQTYDKTRNSWTVIDWDNDGKQDLMYARGASWYVRRGQDSSGNPGLSAEIVVAPRSVNVKQTTIADIDADGLPDIVSADIDAQADPVVKIRKLKDTTGPYPYAFQSEVEIDLVSTKNVLAQCDKPILYSCSTAPVNSKPRVMDLNGDGRVDLIVKLTQTATCQEYEICGSQVVRGERWAAYLAGDSAFTQYEALGAMEKSEFRIVDINGDGYADRITGDVDQSTGNNWGFSINTGTGFTTVALFASIDEKSAKQVQVLDYNGDGYADFLYPEANWQVMEFNGAGFDAAYDSGIPAKASGANLDNWVTAFFDGDGDGRLDAIRGDVNDNGSDSAYMYRNAAPGRATGVVDEITNGLGARTTMTYSSLADPSAPELYAPGADAGQLDYGALPVFEIQAPFYVVQRVESSAPAASSPGNVDYDATSSISYEYGKYRVQSGGRGPLGYGFVRSIDDQTGIETTTTYHQEFPFTGRPASTEIRTSNGDLLSSATNTWSDHNPAGPNHQPFLATGVESVYPTTTTSTSTGGFTVGGTALSSTTTTTTMDPQYGVYGDVGTVRVEVDAAGTQYIKTTTNSYYAPDVSEWHHGRLRSATVVHDRRDNDEPAVTRTSSFTYDSLTGLLVSETIEPGGAQEQTLTTTYEHDSVGNRTEVRVRGYRGPLLQDESGPTIVDRTSTSTFDDDDRYVTTSSNHYGHTDTVAGRNAYGAITVATDAIGNETRTAYGDLGREYWRGDDVGGSTTVEYRPCSLVSCPAGGAYRVLTTSAGGGERMSYFDVLGREIRSATRMFNGNWSSTLTEHDSLGRVVHVSEPFESSSPHSGSALYWTQMTCDHLGRVTSTLLPDASTQTASYDGRVTTYADALAKTRTETKNALGELVRATDHLGGFVDYTYDEQGNLASSTQGAPGETSVVTTVGYDLLGRKTSMSDTDMGGWSYAYNAFGELTMQTDARGDKTEMSYDRLGRMVRRIDWVNLGAGSFSESADSAWIFDTAANGLGQLHVEDTQVAIATPISRTCSYDRYGRAASVRTSITRGASTHAYTEWGTYDQFGRRFQSFDGAAGFSGTEHTYNSYGYLARVDEASVSATTTKTYYEIDAMDARGNVTQLSKGGMQVARAFDPATGRPTDIAAADALTQTVQDLALVWDEAGNLTSKHDQSESGSGARNILETYAYDDLHRLTTVSQGSVDTLAMTYDGLGNITTKHAYTNSGASDSNATVSGSYTYTIGTHRLAATGSSAYVYDANGALSSGDGRTVSWGVHHKPVSISKGSRNVRVYYGPNRSRYLRIDDISQSSEATTHYLGSFEKLFKPNGRTVTRRFIDGEAMIISEDDGETVTETESYLLKDHLGSTDIITDAQGAVVQTMSFDAFGARRNSVDFESLTNTQITQFDTDITTQGFTGHEGLDPVGLVHMNGRVYDPRLGRFMSADPFVQAPSYTQSLNRYAYVWNNPLSYTDPSGHFVFTIGAAVMAKMGIIQGIGDIMVAFTLAGTYDALLRGASLQQALRTGAISGASAGAFAAIGPAATTWGQAAIKGLQFGVVGGIGSVLQGGRFGHGFLAAGINPFVGRGLAGSVGQALGAEGRVIAQVVVAGSVSQATGGKFANGAAYAAFSMAVSSAAEAASRIGSFGGTPEINTTVEVAEYGTDWTAGSFDVGEPGGWDKSAPRSVELLIAAEATTVDISFAATSGVDATFNRQMGLDGLNPPSLMPTPIGNAINDVAMVGGVLMMGGAGRVVSSLGAATRSAGAYGWSTLSPVQRNAALRAAYGTARLVAELKGFSTKGFPERIRLPVPERAPIVRWTGD